MSINSDKNWRKHGEWKAEIKYQSFLVHWDFIIRKTHQYCENWKSAILQKHFLQLRPKKKCQICPQVTVRVKAHPSSKLYLALRAQSMYCLLHKCPCCPEERFLLLVKRGHTHINTHTHSHPIRFWGLIEESKGSVLFYKRSL